MYDQADFDHFNHLLGTAPWDLFIDPYDIDSTWEGFLDLFHAASKDAMQRSRQSKSWSLFTVKMVFRISKHISKLILYPLFHMFRLCFSVMCLNAKYHMTKYQKAKHV